jgi:hypothetical protein
VVSGLNTTTLSWGDTPAPNDPQSSLTFTATSFGSGQGPLLNSVFTLGTLTHSNNVIDIATGITSAKLSLNLNFGATSTFIAPIYDFNILETPNTVIDPLYPLAGCAAWQSSLTPCDDKISLSSLNQGKQFTLNGQLYSFNLLGFSNGEGYSSDMITSENVDTTRNLMASITAVPTPVPVPSALWLLGSGLLGLAGFAKRKRIPQ